MEYKNYDTILREIVDTMELLQQGVSEQSNQINKTLDLLARLAMLFTRMNRHIEEHRKTLYVLATGLIVEFLAVLMLLWMVLTR